jgi:transmembrane sensor
MTAATPSSALPEAIERFARMRASEPSSDEAAEFDRWLEESDAHREAFERVSAQWAAMEALRGDASVFFMREAARAEMRRAGLRRAARSCLAVAGAAAAIAAILIAPGLYEAHLGRQARSHAATYSTAMGEVREIRLADGTVATLDTASVIRVWSVKKARFVELTQGRARFHVAKDASRPFSVLAKGKSVTALGTDFDVYLRPDSLRVTLVEGRLRVKAEGEAKTLPSIDMTAGYQLTASNGGWALAPADASASVSWTQRQLTFEESTLGEIADELNRYSSRKIVIRDPQIARARMSAVIGNRNEQAFLDAVEELHMAKVREADGIYELVAR